MSGRLILILLGFMLTGICIERAESGLNNESGRSSMWSSVKESSDLARKESVDDSLSVFNNNQDDLDGGFSSLDGMLQWAIGMHISIFVYLHGFVIFSGDLCDLSSNYGKRVDD